MLPSSLSCELDVCCWISGVLKLLTIGQTGTFVLDEDRKTELMQFSLCTSFVINSFAKRLQANSYHSHRKLHYYLCERLAIPEIWVQLGTILQRVVVASGRDMGAIIHAGSGGLAAADANPPCVHPKVRKA